MTPYLNLAGQSGVESYELGADFIDIRFRGGGVYRYDHTAPGLAHVHEMQRLARAGRGLSTYISRYVRSAYAAKLG